VALRLSSLSGAASRPQNCANGGDFGLSGRGPWQDFSERLQQQIDLGR
jgi:hypothetical protein